MRRAAADGAYDAGPDCVLLAGVAVFRAVRESGALPD